MKNRKDGSFKSVQTVPLETRASQTLPLTEAIETNAPSIIAVKCCVILASPSTGLTFPFVRRQNNFGRSTIDYKHKPGEEGTGKGFREQTSVDKDNAMG